MVSNFQDINLIQAGKLEARIEVFNPRKVFRLMEDMFSMQAQMDGTQLTFMSTSYMLMQDTIKNLEVLVRMPKTTVYEPLPDFLKGDEMRLT